MAENELKVVDKQFFPDIVEMICAKITAYLAVNSAMVEICHRIGQYVIEQGRNFYIDIVFYYYILKSLILIHLEIDELNHHDFEQMQIYINYFFREMRDEEDKLPIGIILCTDKSDLIVGCILPKKISEKLCVKVSIVPTY
jgi:hypothetical protein